MTIDLYLNKRTGRVIDHYCVGEDWIYIGTAYSRDEADQYLADHNGTDVTMKEMGE